MQSEADRMAALEPHGAEEGQIETVREAITSSSFFIGRGENADGLISFGSGQPDLPPPPAAYEILNDYRGFKYGLVQGEMPLRETLAKEYPHARPEQFVITNGASEAIDLVLRAISVPGGKVLLPRPYYYSYPHNVELAGMTSTFYDLNDLGRIDMDVFEKAVREEGVRAVMINSPSNPTGTVQDVAVLHQIEALCAELSVYLISDEVYKDLIYVRENYLLQGPHVITLNSFSKTYAMCGLRVGYLYTQDMDIVRAVVEMKTHTTMNTSIIAQAMALGATHMKHVYVEEHLPIWQKRRDMIYDGMKKMGLELMKPEGAFYVLPKIKNSAAAVHDLYYNYHMITYNGDWFGAPNHVRFSYALDVAKIEEGLKRLETFLNTEYREY